MTFSTRYLTTEKESVVEEQCTVLRELDVSNTAQNSGLRLLAKLMLNSFWGKFGQVDNAHKTNIQFDGD